MIPPYVIEFGLLSYVIIITLVLRSVNGNIQQFTDCESVQNAKRPADDRQAKGFYCAPGSSLWDTERMALWELMEMS